MSCRGPLDRRRDQCGAGLFRRWPGRQTVERVIVEPALLLAPAHEAAQSGVAPIERAGREVLLSGKELLIQQAATDEF
jgi:hypothetical protein